MTGRTRRRAWLLTGGLLSLLPLWVRSDSAWAWPPIPPEVLGQWVWTRTDVERLREAREGAPTLAAAVRVGSVDGGFRWHRGLSPREVGEEAAILVRFEDSFHTVWTLPAPEVKDHVGEVLARILSQVHETGVRVLELQLDYDVPVRRLPQWAGLLRSLRQGPLAGQPLWVTSVPSHLGHPRYGDLLREVVTGHILQVFDTGLPCTRGAEARLRKAAEHQSMPFRMGIGAFERAREGSRRKHTDHGCWARAARHFRTLHGYAGAWVFPAGEPWAASALALGEGASTSAPLPRWFP